MQTARDRQVIIACVKVQGKNVSWFSASGCVVYQQDLVEVYVGDTLIGAYEPVDKDARDLLLVGLGQDRGIRKDKLAEAFGIGPERLRLIRKKVEERGLAAVFERSPKTGRRSVITPALRRRLYKLFESGLTAVDAFVELKDSTGVKYRTVCRVRQAWLARQQAMPVQLTLVDDDAAASDGAVAQEADSVGDGAAGGGAGVDGVEVLGPRSGRHVQNVGGWMLLALVHALGLHEAVLGRWQQAGRCLLDRLRVALDAVIVALGVGQRCVEGVRRLQASGGDVLLRADRVPSESWTRRVLKQYLQQASAPWVQLDMMQVYLERSRESAQKAAVFYVDNHMRPYTGKHTVRKGWRMQDKRVLPGTTDYYVHDEDGRPVYRLNTPSHDSLTAWLSPLIMFLRAALGDEQRILVAFDRAGAFPDQMMRLREAGIEFVTYERRPYPLLSASAFEEEVHIEKEGSKEPEVIGVHESRNKNLGHGRGRVRRIALRMADGQQVNLLAVSQEPKERLIEVMLGRWVQENAFKHGNERWGINQLDGRKVEHYSPDTIIPNPARRRLDHALRLARQQEGEARRMLARLKPPHPKRPKVQRELADALAMQEQLEAQRPHVPKHTRLDQTELKDKLVHHKGDYKTLLDTIRVAAANAESDLATVLAPHLQRPREVKKALANLFAAPGDVRVGRQAITVTLAPTGRADEQRAFQRMFEVTNRWNLTLPGDPKRRPLRFRSQLP